MLQIPRKKDELKKKQDIHKSDNFNNDNRSVASFSSFQSDISIDPIIRKKAEKIIQNQYPLL